MIITDYQVIEIRDVLAALSYDKKEPAEQSLSGTRTLATSAQPESGTLKDMLARHEESILRDCRQKCGSTRKMAKLLGISQPSVVRKLRQYGIGLDSKER